MISNERIAPEIVRLRLGFDPPPSAAPGQFVHLLCDTFTDDVGHLPPHEERGPGSWRPFGAELQEPRPFLRRPLSVSRVYDDGLETIFQVMDPGLGTRRLAELAVGLPVNCLGPLGHGFAFTDDMEFVLLVGGGVGIPPMIAAGEHLRARGVACHAIAAARRRDLLAVEVRGDGAAAVPVDFERVGVSCEFATDDGSLGHHGLITEPLRGHLQALRGRPGVHVFACGPRPMLKAVAEQAAGFGRPCQVLMEEVMGCGVGVCLACAIRVRREGEAGYVYQRVCTEGPAFDAAELVWE